MSENSQKVEDTPDSPSFEKRGGRFRRRGGPGRFNNPRGRRPYNRQPPREDGDEAPPQDRFHDICAEKLAQIAGPTVDLPPVETSEKKFSGRNRLYIGNLGPEVTEDDLKELFGKYGEFGELFLNKEKFFAFVKYDFYANCEKAKNELDGEVLKGKTLKIRFAPNSAAVRVKNLAPFVSNELLYYAFQVFGEVERALVLVDERGKPTGEGVVEFGRKGFALNAIRKCTERCFFITESLRPVVVEPHESTNDTDGLPEKFLPRRNPDFLKARSKGPRLSEPNTFEHEYGLRWKQLLDLYAKKEAALKKDLQMDMEKLEAQMEYARHEHETELLREELRAREMDRDRQKQEWEMKQRQMEEERRRSEEQIRRQQESLQAILLHQDEEMKRRQQENNLFMQAHQLHSILDEQEQAFQSPQVDGVEAKDDNVPQTSNLFRRGDRWISDRRDFAPKRRRF
ncbi:hrp65 protein [Tribolium castaneum]|uniref:hrp65 protein n=1 Tax=Tribolium castaneum TaxID=7070 RepID=UPI0030FF197D